MTAPVTAAREALRHEAEEAREMERAGGTQRADGSDGSGGFDGADGSDGADGAAAWAGFRSEAGEALAVVALFVGIGLGAALLGGGAYPPPAMADEVSEAPEAPRVWLVDGFNVLHAAVLKGRDRKEWWRQPARARVLELAGGLPDDVAEIFVVFDGEDPDEAPELPPRVQQVFAPSADDWLVRRVKETPRGAPVTVVTADRELADRARHHGAEIVSPRAFAARCRERG